jgi:hypothetical protein
VFNDNSKLENSDKRCRPLEFIVGDHVFLHVSPTKGVLRFGENDMLSPRFIGPFETLESRTCRLSFNTFIGSVRSSFGLSCFNASEVPL